MPPKTFESFEALLVHLREWRSWGDPDSYDFSGMVQLLGACIDSLQAHALDAEINEISDYLDEGQQRFLVRLARSAQDQGGPSLSG